MRSTCQPPTAVPVQTAARAVLLVTVGAAFLSSLDLFVVNVAFDAIGDDFGIGRPGGPAAGDLSWVLNGLLVALAVAVTFGLGALGASSVTYLVAERLLRPWATRVVSASEEIVARGRVSNRLLFTSAAHHRHEHARDSAHDGAGPARRQQ